MSGTRLVPFLIGGAIFGAGLALSGMTRPEVVLSFLLFEDFGLMLVMGGAIFVTLPVYRWWRRPVLAESPEPFLSGLSLRTVLGSVIFGVGWGLSGVCPGAAFASVGCGNHPILVAVAGMFVGGWIQGLWAGARPSPGAGSGSENTASGNTAHDTTARDTTARDTTAPDGAA